MRRSRSADFGHALVTLFVHVVHESIDITGLPIASVFENIRLLYTGGALLLRPRLSFDMQNFDIVVWGATGFTGRLLCEHLLRHYEVFRASEATLERLSGTLWFNTSLRESLLQADIKWALAGRNAKKLEDLRIELKSMFPNSKVALLAHERVFKRQTPRSCKSQTTASGSGTTDLLTHSLVPSSRKGWHNLAALTAIRLAASSDAERCLNKFFLPQDLHVLLGNVTDHKSMLAVANNTKVLLSTAGPLC